MGTWVCTWVRYSASMTTSDSRSPLATSPRGPTPRGFVSGPRTLPFWGRPWGAPPPPAVAGCSVGPGKTRGASSFIASSSPVTWGRGSYSTLMSFAAASAARGLSAATAAMGWPA